jgi:hypothetical protein
MWSLALAPCSAILGLDNLVHAERQRLSFVPSNVVNDVMIDAKIIVNESVSHACHLAPFHVGISRSKIFGNLLGGFADNLNGSYAGPSNDGVLYELFYRH